MDVKVVAVALRHVFKDLGDNVDAETISEDLYKRLPFNKREREVMVKAINSDAYRIFTANRNEHNPIKRKEIVKDTTHKLGIILDQNETTFVIDVLCRAISWEISIGNDEEVDSDIERALKYLSEKNYKEAFTIVSRLASQKNAQAINFLATMYDNGRVC